MKKITILLLISAMLSTVAVAQSHRVNTEQKTLKNTIKDKKEDKHEVGGNLAHLRVRSALRGRREVRRHRRSISRQGERQENRGVQHPIMTAKRQAKTEKDAGKE